MREKPHKKLDLWQKSITLASLIYQITKGFPPEERYGLTSQMRRSCISVASNIAEGAARQSKKEFIQFLHISQSSLSELDTQWEIADNLSFFKDNSKEKIEALMTDIDKLISGLIKSLKVTDF